MITIPLQTFLAHSQSGLTALKLAQSEGHQDISDILLQYSRQGPKVITPTDDEESTKVKPPPLQEAEVDGQSPSEVRLQATL